MRLSGALDHERAFALVLVTLLTPLALLIHGYHPYAEDGGIYAAGIKHLLRPELYRQSAPFVEEHLRFSLFAPLVAALVRLVHHSLPATLLALHLATLWAMLFATWMLASRCYTARTARAGAVILTTLWLTLPVAGTSLILMDPYLTARSFSLPCSLFALAGTLDLLDPYSPRVRSLLLCTIPLLCAALIHPLMAGYAFATVLLLVCFRSSIRSVRLFGPVALYLLAVACAAILYANAPSESSDYAQAALSRYYWFLSRWQWYEVLGLAAPLAIFAAFLRSSGGSRAAPATALAKTCLAAGLTAIVITLCFAHPQGANHLVARLQPLRIFAILYAVMILLLGAAIGEHLLKTFAWRWLLLIALFAPVMAFVQRQTYPASDHIEWPGATPRNGWQQAFVWIAHNTPTDALFALDADYIAAPEEDAQSFRAMAERSALPDYSKDGGEASISPYLTPAWIAGQRAQQHLSTEFDNQRLSALRPFNVTWIVLQRGATTAFDCPYRNPVVEVCRLP